MAKTDEEYRAAPNRCPVCDSEDIVGEELNIEGCSAYQYVSCSSCSSNWCDVYHLTGYAELEEAEVTRMKDEE